MWSTLGKNFSGIVSLCLSDIVFINASSFAQVICAFPCLQELSIRSAIQSTSAGVFESKPLPSATTFCLPPDLHTICLGITGLKTILEWLLSLPALPALRTVRLEPVQDEDLAMFHKFIRALGNHLESITLSTHLDECMFRYVILMVNLTVLTTISGTHHSIDITPLTHLRSIRFVLNSAYRNRWVTQILSQISSVHLEEVVFALQTFVWGFGFGIAGALEWSEVDAVLQCSTFSQLRNVELQSGRRAFSARVIKLLPRCHARGILLC
jgi:hypothetical protein